MLVPRAFWRPVGAAVGRVAPGAMRSYYRAVVRSYVSGLRRTPGVRAVYAYSSFAGGTFRPGRSDVDLVVATEAPTVAAEVELLLRLRGRYRRHQALLPIDVLEIPEAEFADTAAWATAMRPRMAAERPARAVSEWRLLFGSELRSASMWQPDPRLAVAGDYFVLRAIRRFVAQRRPGPAIARYLAELERDVEREGISGRYLDDLRRSRARLARGSSQPAAVEAALGATLGVLEQHRRMHALPRGESVTREAGWSVPAPDDDSVRRAERLLGTLGRDASAVLRSATLFVQQFEGRVVCLLECEDADAARPVLRWAISGGAARAAYRDGIDLHIVTSELAEDVWRACLECYAIVGGGRPLAGERLAPRISLPERRFLLTLLHYEGFWSATTIRWALLGHRNHKRVDSRLLHAAAERTLAAGGPPLLDARALMAETPELRSLGSDDAAGLSALADAEWARRGLEIWRGWPPLPAEEREAQAPRAP